MKRLLAALFLVLATTFPGNAHSTLVSTTPAADSVLTEFPTEVSLTFNENLLTVGEENPNKVEVVNSMGDLLSSAAVVNGPVITVPVQIIGNDQYQVKYRVVSADGHVIEGSYGFKVESEIATAMPISAPIEEPEDGPNLLVRAVQSALVAAAFFGMLRLRRRK
ncbi:MAG: copper resistance protein CopC [Candidatus Nanopelagicaceae bacterium]|nr:copper resistance protein CopC [Candidatus Nanopelagicaceae bacterium]